MCPLNRGNSRQILLYAQDQGHLKDIPIKRSLMMKDPKKQHSFYSYSEAMALLNANRNEEIYPILYLVLHTGLRRGEALGLCWDRVNFISGNIEVTRTLHQGRNLQQHTKGKKLLQFPMTENVKAFFMELRRTQKNPEFVFTDESGKPFNPNHFSNRDFKKACERAGVRKLRFHDLRHTFASLYVMDGGNVFALKELLAHSDIKDTMKYTHLTPKHLREAAHIVNFGESFSREKATGPLLALANNK